LVEDSPSARRIALVLGLLVRGWSGISLLRLDGSDSKPGHEPRHRSEFFQKDSGGMKQLADGHGRDGVGRQDSGCRDREGRCVGTYHPDA